MHMGSFKLPQIPIIAGVCVFLWVIRSDAKFYLYWLRKKNQCQELKKWKNNRNRGLLQKSLRQTWEASESWAKNS